MATEPRYAIVIVNIVIIDMVIDPIAIVITNIIIIGIVTVNSVIIGMVIDPIVAVIIRTQHNSRPKPALPSP